MFAILNCFQQFYAFPQERPNFWDKALLIKKSNPKHHTINCKQVLFDSDNIKFYNMGNLFTIFEEVCAAVNVPFKNVQTFEVKCRLKRV